MDKNKALKIVLDYVERWNKSDEDKQVAEAASFLERNGYTSSKKCKIDYHVPTEFGTRCICSYFRKKDMNVHDAYNLTRYSIPNTIEKIRKNLKSLT